MAVGVEKETFFERALSKSRKSVNGIAIDVLRLRDFAAA
jgi:hypothetical protein